MTEQITQLTGAEFDEGTAFLDMVFGEHRPHDFAAMLPTIYRPTDEHMSCNYAIRRDGEIMAVVGLFPMTWHVGDRQLRIGGIGSVSAHPKTRGQGLMQTLMKHCVEIMKTQAFDASWLAGQRQRYLYFGYEKCGNAPHFSINRANIRHCYDGNSQIHFESIAESDTQALAKAKELHDGQLMHCERSLTEFASFLVAWHHRPWAAVDDGSGEMVGYLVADEKGTSIAELAATSTGQAVHMVRAWVMREGGQGEITLKRNPVADDLTRELARICEQQTVHASGNWQIFEWPSVIEALMVAKCRGGALGDGQVVVGIDGYGAVDMSVSDGEPACARADGGARPDVQLDAATAMRLLFGPLKAAQVTELSSRARVLESWCPLPLSWTDQDGV